VVLGVGVGKNGVDVTVGGAVLVTETMVGGAVVGTAQDAMSRRMSGRRIERRMGFDDLQVFYTDKTAKQTSQISLLRGRDKNLGGLLYFQVGT
jgi:hypothetical protein